MEIASQDLIEQIQKIAAGKEQPFAVFDFDNTCIKGDIAEAAVSFLCKKGQLPETVMHEYEQLLASGETQKAFLLYAAVLAGIAAADIDAIVAGAIATEGLAARPIILDLAHALEKAGTSIWIVSASPEMLVASAMRVLGFPGHVIGLKNDIVGGRLTESVRPPFSILGGKVDCIKKYIRADQRPVFAIGDSPNDLPMLEYAAYAAVIDRAGSPVEAARQNGWTIVPE